MNKSIQLSTVLLKEYQSIVGCLPELSDVYRSRFDDLCLYLESQTLFPKPTRRRRLIAAINRKFEFNREAIGRVYAHAAAAGKVFNYHEKSAIQASFDLREESQFLEAIRKAGAPAGLIKELAILFAPVSEDETISRLSAEIRSPSKLRIEAGDRDIGNEIATAALSSFVFNAAKPEVMHAFFDRTYRRAEYRESFWEQLRQDYPALYSRNKTLDVLRIDQNLLNQLGSVDALRAAVFSQIRISYTELENHGHFALWIEPLKCNRRNVTWELACDAMLFGEKHDEVQLNRAYFRHKQISAETISYISNIDESKAAFALANEGFTYRDTFVCPPALNSKFGEESLLILFQKNKRDETLIPCPACRSHEVQGNSYPSLGVRSWECSNLLCPDRSKYNRGKRYSFKALLMQEAIEEEESQIPPEFVRKWSRDVQVGCNFSNALEMLTRHFSLAGDGVVLRRPPGQLSFDPALAGRRVNIEGLEGEPNLEAAQEFFDSAWFERYAIPAQVNQCKGAPSDNFSTASKPGLSVVHGDSAWALRQFPDGYFHAAVTSPPYYNAREYAQWPNIYCHMYDMQRIAAECFRVLKSGGLYLYNLFDYFDNERSIVFSAMGDKRLILSAYTVDSFRRAGFELLGSTTWDKGEIEGKRAFNAGNFSPYYQAPFNCWEHVLVFRKPGASEAIVSGTEKLPSVLRAKPVMKMVRGENVHGHTAPFPNDIPALLRLVIPPGGRVLDPFGGSGTTARALKGFASEVVCVERSREYCELALRLYEEHTITNGQSKLFDS
jgi:DNA modification methylase